MSNRILPLTDVALQLLKRKHPESRQPPPEVLVEGPIRKIYPAVYSNIDFNQLFRLGYQAEHA